MSNPTNQKTSGKAPAFQFYPKDFLSSLDVQMMSASEVGAYVLLLANSWIAEDQCFLSDDEPTLIFLSRLTPEQWEASKAKILKKFKKKGDFIYNERLLEERQKQIDFRLKQAKNGAKGGRPPKPKEPNNNPSLSQKNPSLSQTKPNLKPKKGLQFAVSGLQSASASSSSLKPKPLSEFLGDFKKIISDNEISEKGYLDKTIEQIPRCKKEDIEKIRIKAEKIENCIKGGRFDLAGVIFREIAGLVNDSQMAKLRE